MRTGFQDAGFPSKGQASDSCCGRRCSRRDARLGLATPPRIVFSLAERFGVLWCETNWLYSDFFSFQIFPELSVFNVVAKARQAS